GEVVAVVDLRVDLAALVHVGARLREVGEDLRVPRLGERPLPERRLRGLGADLALRRLRLLALLAVDDEEAVEQRLRGRPLRQQLGDLGPQERFAELDGVAREGARLQLAGYAARGHVAGLVARGDGDRRAGRVVVRQRD